MDNGKLVKCSTSQPGSLFMQLQFREILYKLCVLSMMMRACSMKEKSMYDTEVQQREQAIAWFLKCN